MGCVPLRKLLGWPPQLPPIRFAPLGISRAHFLGKVAIATTPQVAVQPSPVPRVCPPLPGRHSALAGVDEVVVNGLGVSGAEGSPGQSANSPGLATEIAETASMAIAQIWAAYAKGGALLGIAHFLTVGASPLQWVLGASSEQNQIFANYKKLGGQIYKWSMTFRQWAEAGKRDDGTAYSWTRWADFGKDLASDISFQSNLIWDTVPLKITFDTLVETARQLNPANPKAWPMWLKALVGAGGLLGAAYVINTALRVRREARGVLKERDV